MVRLLQSKSPTSLFISATSTTGLSKHSTISYVKDGTAGTDAITADISGNVMQIPVDADGKAVSSISFNVTFRGWQGHVSKPCTASVGTLPPGMTAAIGTDTITLTVAKDATLGGEIAGEVEINITCCGLVFAKKASWVKALDAAQIQGDIEELKVSRNDHEARLTAVKATADNAGNKAAVNETNIAATAEKLNSTVTRLTTAEGDISNAQSQINQQASEISLKVTAVQNGSEISGAKLEISSTEGGMIKLDADKVIAPGTISADKLKANILDIVNILLGEGGSIHSGIYDSQGNKTGSGKGVFIGADGVSKMTGLILDDGTIQADAIETVNEPLEDDPLVHKPFPATKDCHYPNPQLATWLKSKLTANVYKVASGTFGSDTVTGLMNTVSSADVSIGSGRTDKAVIKTFTTPAEYPTSIRIQASPISWHDEWEESSGRWVRLGSQQHTGPIPPEDTSPPSNPQDGDTYSEVSNVTSNIGPHPMYSWTETTYQYRVTTTTHTNDGNYNLKVTVNGEVKHDTNLSYDQILSLAPSSTIVIEYSGHANGYNFEGSWDVSYNNYRYYGKRLVYFNASKNPVTIPETGMANTALSVTVDGATITGGNGKTSWANLTPCSLFQGVLQKGAQLINLTAALSNDTISFSAQPYGESEVLITTAKSIMVDGSMLSIISSDGSSYSTYGKWYTSWSLSNCVPIEKGKGVYVRTLRPKKKEAGDNEPRRVGTDDDKFDEIISEKFIGYVNGTEEQSNEKLYKVWGAVVNPG
ncbi:MAG: hypothetical protein ACTTJW_00020 [Sphaerochaeta sp.]